MGAVANRRIAAREPAAPEAGERPLSEGRPPNYLRLATFFESKTALARALGVHRDTLAKWDEGRATKLRRTSVLRVRVMAAVCEQVARYMPNDTSVGTWLLQPQPALGGRVPAEMVREQPTLDVHDHILRAAAVTAEPVSVGDLANLPGADVFLGTLSDELGVQATVTEPAPDPDADPDYLASLQD